MENIEVKVTYPSAHGPAERSFPPTSTVGDVKAFALAEFGLTEGTVDGNQIVFFLYFREDRQDDLARQLQSFPDHPNNKLHFRLSKEIIAG
jgi:hypothetical protein